MFPGIEEINRGESQWRRKRESGKTHHSHINMVPTGLKQGHAEPHVSQQEQINGEMRNACDLQGTCLLSSI